MDLDGFLKIARHPILAAAVGMKITRFQRVLFALVILGLDAYAYFRDCYETPAVSLSKYGQCSGLVSSHFVIIKLLLLTANPLSSIRRKGEDGDPASLPLKSRLERGANLSWNLRGIGLNTQIQYLPPYSFPRDRWAFVLSQFYRLFLHAIRLVVIWGPSMHLELHKTLMKNEPPAQTVFGIIFQRAFFTTVVLVTSFVCIDTAYTIVAILGVGSGYSDPTAWPPSFGSWFDATTVRRSWGRCWHQNYRTPYMMMSDFLINDTLGIRKGTNASSYGKLFVSFTISGLMHAAGDYAMYGGSRWFSMRFFVAQAVAITVEDFFIAIGDQFAFRTRFPEISSLLGYLWVISWFCFTLPPYGEAFLPAITSD